MTYYAGNCWRLSRGEPKGHIWIIIKKLASKEWVIVNITSLKINERREAFKDKSCVLDPQIPEDEQILKMWFKKPKESIVLYGRTDIISESQLDTYSKNKVEDAPSALVDRILAGAQQSEHTPNNIKKKILNK